MQVPQQLTLNMQSVDMSQNLPVSAFGGGSPGTHTPYLPEPLFQSPWSDNFQADPNAMDPVFFENMAHLSPVTARVGAIPQLGEFEHYRSDG